MALTCNKYTDPITQRSYGYLSGTYTAASVASETAASATCNADAAANITIASGVMTIKLGFVPTFFQITNVTDRLTQTWQKGLNTGDFIEQVAAGDRTLETDDQVTIATSGTATSGSVPGVEPTGLVTVTFAGGAATDNDTVIWEARA